MSAGTHTIRDNGIVIFTDRETGREDRYKTLQCVHCGGHWIHRPGSGIVRGFCMACGGPICGPGCLKCVPTEQLLENIERGMPEDFRPIRVSLGGIALP